MRIGALSDMHGLLPKVAPCELLFICGDTIPMNCEPNIEGSLGWLERYFIPWIEEIPVDQVYLIAGNHDMVFERSEHRAIDTLSVCDKVHYLNCESEYYISNDGLMYKIYGSPYCKVYGNWSFMIDDDAIYERMSNMPEDIDFLLTHDAPYGISDICRNDGVHIGNKAIREIILEKKPKYNFHGHLHSSNHEMELLGDTKVYGVSILDESYKREYSVLYLNID